MNLHARNNQIALDNYQLQRLAPSIFADKPWQEMSDKYQFIPTINIVEALRKEGFMPVSAQQSRVRIDEKREFAKHLIRFRRLGEMISKIGDLFPEIVILNSHDGSTKYKIALGIFRLICLNGAIVADANLGDIRVRHTGNIIQDVIEGSYRMASHFPLLAQKVEAMQGVILSRDDQEAFADAALMVRFPQKEGDEPHYPLTVEQVLAPRRPADNLPDLWTTFQRIQENTVRGGLLGRDRTGRPRRTRGIGGIDQNVGLNRALWSLAEYLRAAKMGEELPELVQSAEPAIIVQ